MSASAWLVPLARPDARTATANGRSPRTSLALSGRQHQARVRSSLRSAAKAACVLAARSGWPAARDWSDLSMARAVRALTGAHEGASGACRRVCLVGCEENRD